MVPPMLLYLRFDKPESRGFGLWLPLFLVWLILLPIVVLALAISLVADAALFLVGARYHHYTLLLFRCFGLLGATRGTTVTIRADRTDIEIDLV